MLGQKERTPSTNSEIINDPDKLTLTVLETANLIGISKEFCYEQLQKNNIPHIKIQGKYVISKKNILDLIAGKN